MSEPEAARRLDIAETDIVRLHVVYSNLIREFHKLRTKSGQRGVPVTVDAVARQLKLSPELVQEWIRGMGLRVIRETRNRK
mgnify:FL=1